MLCHISANYAILLCKREQKSSITVTLKTSTLLKVCTCVHMYDINSSIIYLVSPYSFKQDFSSTFHAHNISNWLNFPEILYYVGKKTLMCMYLYNSLSNRSETVLSNLATKLSSPPCPEAATAIWYFFSTSAKRFWSLTYSSLSRLRWFCSLATSPENATRMRTEGL